MTRGTGGRSAPALGGVGVLKLARADFTRRAGCPLCGRERYALVGKGYLPDYFCLSAQRAVAAPGVSRLRLLRRCLSCRLVYYGYVPNPGALARLSVGVSGSRWRFDERRLPEQKIRAIREHSRMEVCLDVGGASGEFLGLLRDRARELWTVDPFPSESLAGDAAIRTVPQAIEEASLPNRHFTLVTMWDVIEHVHDVGRALRNVRECLAPGGVVAIETGAMDSIPGRLFRGFWQYVSLFEHLNFFTKRVMEQALVSLGFRICLSKRTAHSRLAPREYLSAAAKAAVQVALSCGGTMPGLYRSVMRLAGRAGGGISLPCRDHVFVVAKKLGRS